MFKKRKGYFLLTMLVLTGLAGRTHTDNLPGKERRFLLNEIKTAKINFINVIEGLNRKQLNYHPEKNALCIMDYLSRIFAIQNDLLKNLKLTHPENIIISTNESALDNRELLNCINDGDKIQYFTIKNPNIHSSKEAINNYKKQNTNILTYVRTATDNLHHHIIKTPVGKLDVYQTIDLIAAYTVQSLNDINKIKTNPAFPK